MMLETVLTAAITSLLVSVGAVFLMEWGTRMRVRRARFDIDDILERLMKQDRQRAGVASQLRKQNGLLPLELSATDAALVAKHGPGRATVPTEGESAWFDSLLRK